MQPLRGSFCVLVLFDVAEQIQLDQLRDLVGAEQPRREPTFKHPAPEYVRFERPPVVEYLPAPLMLSTGESFQCRVKYFDYGVVSVELETPFDTDWDRLVRLSGRWISEPEIEKCTAELIAARMLRAKAALIQPYDLRLSEDYYVIHLKEARNAEGQPVEAADMLAAHGPHIAQIIRGELAPLAEAERAEALQPSPTIRTICWWWDGPPRWFTTRRRAGRPRSNYWNTRTHSYWNSGITTMC